MGNKLAVIVAVLLGGVAALAMQTYLEEEKNRQEARFRSLEIVVANRPIKEGEALNLSLGRNSMIAVQEFPERMVKSGMLTRAEARRYRGYIALRAVEPNAPVFKQDLQAPLEHVDSVESVVAEGKRAVTLSVDMISGVAGLIRQGDRVDVIGSFNLAGTAGGQRSVKTSYLLQNARVIALDNKSSFSVREKKAAARVYRAVTLEVDPQDALRLINAQEQGRIRLLLRHRSDVAQAPQKRNGRPVVVDVPAHELQNAVPHALSGPQRVRQARGR